MTCSVKGCTAPPFSDPKEFKKHRQESHGFQKHDHSHKIPCPDRSCGRRKQSRGFVSITALREHQKRFHGIEPPPLDGVEAGSPDDEINADTSRPSADAALEDAEGEDDDDGDTPEVEGHSILSAPARHHMEVRLRQMETERARLDDEIKKMRHKLYGEASTVTEMQAMNGAEVGSTVT